jgi:hypothetical protein
MISPPPVAPRDSWLSPAIEVRASPIEGRGLHAVRPIARGEIVYRLGGQVIDDATLAALTPPYSSVTLGGGWNLLTDPAHPVRYGNHACDPNCWHDDATTISARRPIAAGEELTLDYATNTGVEAWSLTCRCGAPTCRGTVTGADWRRPELQTAYGDHWSPSLLAKIRSAAS